MGTTALRQLLKSLCSNSYWNYAVFWKLEHQSQMILTWEDGYCDHPIKPKEPVESTDDIYYNGTSELCFLDREESIQGGISGGYPIGLAVADMSCIQYAFGEGVVGKAAYTGNHCWILYDNIFSGEFNSKLAPECPDEWLLQFASGIKTILLVPVLPHGVLQLGSLEAVAEDLTLVAHVKDRFNALQNVVENSMPFTSNRNTQAQSSSEISSLIENLDESSSVITNSQQNKMQYEDSKTVDSVKLNKNKLSTLDHVMPLLAIQDALPPYGDDVNEILRSANANKIGHLSMSFTQASNPSDQSINASPSETDESKLFRLSYLEEDWLDFSQGNNYVAGASAESSYGILNSYSSGDITDQPFGDKDASDTYHKRLSSFLSFPFDCELHEALRPVNQRTGEYTQDSSVSVKDACGSPSLVCSRDHIVGIEPSAWESCGWFSKGSDSQYLLEAVVASVCNGSDETSSSRSNSVRSSTTLSGQFGASSQQRSQSEARDLVEDDLVPWSHITSTFVAGTRNAFTNSSTLDTFKGMMSTLIDEKQMRERYVNEQPRKGTKSPNVSKRRARPGDTQRPRPRDRQMIQDRVKELRELVPNGAKCSIDGLLDKTIKHMLFLRSVTDQAEKLRQFVHPEDADRKSKKFSETKDGPQIGTSWAFEFGSDLPVCPIVVEDLEYPGHMLIEMLCNEHGVFLEIAQMLRHLKLTILKGAMESRTNSTWAHFIVEASKGFHRMDIFWPLMQLWQHKRNPISSKI